MSQLTTDQKIDVLYRRLVLGENIVAPGAPSLFGDGGNAARPMPSYSARPLLPQLEVSDAPVKMYKLRNVPGASPVPLSVQQVLSREVAALESVGEAIADATRITSTPEALRGILRTFLNSWFDMFEDFPATDFLPYTEQLVGHFREWRNAALTTYWDRIAIGQSSPFDRSIPPPDGYQAPSGMPLSELLKKGNAV